MAILPNLQQQNAELQAKLDAMAAEMAKLKASKQTRLSMKVSDKGALSLYGMGRFPVTLYRSQWERLIAHTADITAFIEANAHLLKSKDD